MVRGVLFLWVVHVSPVWLRHGCLNSHPSWLSSPFLLLKTSPILEKSYLFLSVCLSKKFPLQKYILFSYLYGSLTLMGNIFFFFLLEMHVDMGSMARLEIPKLQPMESASR